MSRPNRTSRSPLTEALEAIGNLWVEGFAHIEHEGQTTSLMAHGQIKTRPFTDRAGILSTSDPLA